MSNIPHAPLLKNRGKEALSPTFMDLDHVKTPQQAALVHGGGDDLNISQILPLSNNQVGSVMKKMDRLPNFTVNYLQLMDQCTENIQSKQGKVIGNPFISGYHGGENLSKNNGAVFKENKLPRYKNFPFMSKRHMIQSQLHNSSLSSPPNQEQMLEKESGLKTPQITINRLAAVQKADSRSQSNTPTRIKIDPATPHLAEKKRQKALSVIKPNKNDEDNILLTVSDPSKTQKVQQIYQNTLSKTFHQKMFSPQILSPQNLPNSSLVSTPLDSKRANTSQKGGAPMTFYFQNQHFKHQLQQKQQAIGDKIRQLSKSQLNSYPSSSQDEKMIIVAGINLQKGGLINIQMSRPSPQQLTNSPQQQNSALIQGWTQSRGKQREGVVHPHNTQGFGAGHHLSGTHVDIEQYSQRNGEMTSSFHQEKMKATNKHNSLGLIDEKNQSSSSITNAQQLTARNVQQLNNKSLADVSYVPIPLNQIKIITHNNLTSKQITVIGNSNSQIPAGQNSGLLGTSLNNNGSNHGVAISNPRKTVASNSGQGGVAMGKEGSQHQHKNHHLSFSSANEDEDVISMMQSMMIGQGKQHFQLQPPQHQLALESERNENKMKKGVTRVGQFPPPLNLSSMTKEEIEHLVPWRYQSKDYFMKAPPPQSPSSLAPKSQALSTEVHKNQQDKRTQLQRMMMRDNPQFLNSLDEFMIHNSTIKSSTKSPETLLKTVAEVMQAKRDKTPLNSIRGGGDLFDTTPSHKKSPQRPYNHRPSRLNNYHIDAIEEGKQGYKRKKSPQKQPNSNDFYGSIETDKKNLHNVFGMPLKSHWVFRGNSLEQQQQQMAAQPPQHFKVPNIVAKPRGGGGISIQEKGAEHMQEPAPKPLKVKNSGGGVTGSSGMISGESPQPWKNEQRDLEIIASNE